jgi:hypothetical protein
MQGVAAESTRRSDDRPAHGLILNLDSEREATGETLIA